LGHTVQFGSMGEAPMVDDVAEDFQPAYVHSSIGVSWSAAGRRAGRTHAIMRPTTAQGPCRSNPPKELVRTRGYRDCINNPNIAED
jgi:hypothetical protein